MDKNMIKKDISYRLLKESELPGISRLIRSMKEESNDTLNIRDNSIEYYSWMYFKNPVGNAIIASAWHNDILIGCFAIAPKLVQINKESLVIGKTMEIFTDPAFQGIGIMTKLANLVFEESIKRGITDWYVTPSKNSYPIFKNKWNYFEPFELHYKYRIINIHEMAKTIAMTGIKKKLFLFGSLFAQPFFKYKKINIKNISIKPIERFTDDFDNFWASTSADYDNILIRNSDYLNWRYIENPDDYQIYSLFIGQKIKGYIVTKITVRKGVKTGEIVDLLFRKNQSEIGITLIEFAQRELYNSGCAICEAWDFNDSYISEILIKSGLSKKRSVLKFVLSPDSNTPEFYSAKKWYVTQSDGNDI